VIGAKTIRIESSDCRIGEYNGINVQDSLSSLRSFYNKRMILGGGGRICVGCRPHLANIISTAKSATYINITRDRLSPNPTRNDEQSFIFPFFSIFLWSLEKHSPLGLLLIVSDFFFKFKNFLF
jgi:hypothetical protein